ncbi:carbohydrate ABC transporter membrane protein 1, CUT1 family [Raineyella antarctica]|uniref:Maltose/maltodextrin transport system permease protein n=1 Tax=Raineyella antarctica TaxID=1577474 RepID=A0A1G6GHF9_9ACTN|nr:ABC transporter permease subunit [Raineyella antarctica]SDB81329.1 carbohydrate ABC transporter membrane protein 1, CUT1 family [Raineyella antarctica]
MPDRPTTPATPERRKPVLQREGWGITGTNPLALLAKIIGLGLVLAIAVALAGPLLADGRWVLFGVLVASTLLVLAVYVQPYRIPPKYLLPGLAFLLVFQVVPVLLTITTAFTNFGDGHRGPKEDAIVSIESSSVQRTADSIDYVLTVAAKGPTPDGKLVFLLTDPATRQVQIGTADGLTPAPDAQVGTTGKVTELPGYTVLDIGQASARAKDIENLSVPTARGAIRASGVSRAYEGSKTRSYAPQCDCITDKATGQTWTADPKTGYFVSSTGDRLPQGWRVNVGLGNFQRLFADPVLGKHFTGMIIWNFVFALAVVFGTFAVGLLIALALNNPLVRGLKFYRVLIVLPYAMPSFAMLLVWRDMFNQDFGLVNQLLGTDLNWFGDATLAKLAVITIQFWLGYPYMFLVTTGALQSIPSDLTEAAAVDGASRWLAFRTVTLPLLLVSTAPLLIASFSFNFNNYNAIGLTTEGGPFPPDSPTAGGTDLLISYTYRLAFGAGGAQYGFAAAVSLVIFLIVATVSVIGFRRTAVLEEIN